ncbi:MAG: hypothetical protein AB1726_16010 [Planctomycetota bacterium]
MSKKVTTKEIQENLVSKMKLWQKIEDASVNSTGQIIEQTDNPLIRTVMEIIQSDSHLHYKVQSLIVATLSKQAIPLTPEELGSVWSSIDKHIQFEKQMVGYVQEALDQIKGRKMLIQEYLLNYLLRDEEKHDALLAALEKIKAGMYPYGA